MPPFGGESMKKELIMVQLVEAIFWFDEALQSKLKQHGWEGISRTQSMILANVADGETRPSRIAEKLGLSRQTMSHTLADMVDRRMIRMEKDPNDKRALIIVFSEEIEPMRNDAISILESLEVMLERKWGKGRTKSVREALAIEWRQLGTD